MAAEISGFVLEFANDPFFRSLRDRMKSNFENLHQVRVGSCFSGWGMLEMICHNFQTTWNIRMSPQIEAGLPKHSAEWVPFMSG